MHALSEKEFINQPMVVNPGYRKITVLKAMNHLHGELKGMIKNGELFLVVCRRSDDGSIGNELDGAVYRSADGAESWTRMKLPEGTNGPMSLVIDPENN